MIARSSSAGYAAHFLDPTATSNDIRRVNTDWSTGSWCTTGLPASAATTKRIASTHGISASQGDVILAYSYAAGTVTWRYSLDLGTTFNAGGTFSATSCGRFTYDRALDQWAWCGSDTQIWFARSGTVGVPGSIAASNVLTISISSDSLREWSCCAHDGVAVWRDYNPRTVISTDPTSNGCAEVVEYNAGFNDYSGVAIGVPHTGSGYSRADLRLMIGESIPSTANCRCLYGQSWSDGSATA